MKIEFSPAADEDLTEIALFIAARNPARALSFVDELEARCKALGASPGIGASRPELGGGIRMLPFGRYLIFHRKVEKGLRIERIMHSARDIKGDDFNADEADAGD